MVEFDGVKLSSVAPVDIIDIVVSAPSVELTTQSVPLMDGARFVRRKRGVRTVTVTFVVMENDEEKHREHIAAIADWATSEGLCVLKTTQETNGYLMAVCSQYPDQSSREFWGVMSLVFTATDPCYVGNTEYTQDVLEAVALSGKEPPMVRIEQDVSSTMTDPTWRCGEEYIRLKSVSPGLLIIDMYDQTITLNGESIMEQMTIDSDFFDMSKDNNQITCENGAGGTLYWRKRWI